jgi:hypothetical protein
MQATMQKRATAGATAAALALAAGGATATVLSESDSVRATIEKPIHAVYVDWAPNWQCQAGWVLDGATLIATIFAGTGAGVVWYAVWTLFGAAATGLTAASCYTYRHAPAPAQCFGPTKDYGQQKYYMGGCVGGGAGGGGGGSW